MTPTPKQKATLEFVRDYIKTHGYAPTVQEIAGHLGVLRNAALCSLLGLEKRGLLKVVRNIHRGIVLHDAG